MIVPRSFSPPRLDLNEKNVLVDRGVRTSSKSRSKSGRSQSPLQRTRPAPEPLTKSALDARSEPVKIPSRSMRHSQSRTATTNHTAPTAVHPAVSYDRQTPTIRFRQGSAKSMLSATAIPARRKPRGRPSQRLPNCNYVADFSKLLLDDIQPTKNGSSPRSHSSSYMDGLFGNIDELVEGQMIIGSEGLDESVLSTRSISSESLPSLASPDDFSAATSESHRSSMDKALHERPTPRTFASEDCADNHPLAQLDDIDELSLDAQESHPPRPSSPPSRALSPMHREVKSKPRSSFKSTLTSSFKALKSAARTTLLSSSAFGLHGAAPASFCPNESFLAHNFFDIQPSLTDDRRPPPALCPPSPELRRYLNPQMASAPADSPTQLHFWQDERYLYDPKQVAQQLKDKTKHKSRRKRSPTPKSKLDSLPAVVPLSTCLPPTIRTAHASSPPIWLTPDGEPVNKNTSTPLLYDPSASIITANGIPRNREPRENRDFLRVFVCEMAMRRSGKLNDDLAAGRARLWLPPVAGFQNGQGTAGINGAIAKKSGAERWKAWSPEDADNEIEITTASAMCE